MRKFVALLTVAVLAILAVVAVSAEQTDQEKIDNRAPQVPIEVATYIVESGVCDDKINFEAKDGWGNSVSIPVNRGEFKVSGRGVGGSCFIPLTEVGDQTVLDILCKPGQVNTSRNNWGNASRVAIGHKKGDFKISGSGVGGHCWLDSNAAALVFNRVPKFAGDANPF